MSKKKGCFTRNSKGIEQKTHFFKARLQGIAPKLLCSFKKYHTLSNVAISSLNIRKCSKLTGKVCLNVKQKTRFETL